MNPSAGPAFRQIDVLTPFRGLTSIRPALPDRQSLRLRSQAAKAVDCKSTIPGSNPGGAFSDRSLFWSSDNTLRRNYYSPRPDLFGSLGDCV